jgi:hypothetical protein
LIRRTLISFFFLLALSATSSYAQHWKIIFKVPSTGSAASFYNPDIGCIGTGNYPAGYFGQIYYTTDAGRSWTRSLIPNMDFVGQVTDLYYVDRWNVWATLVEKNEHGWSGIYKSIDGGKTWKLWYQAVFPVSIREIKSGIFYTDRYLGIRRSIDGGNTFQTVAPSGGALGLDFLDNNIGISSSEGNSADPTYVTGDGGNNWVPFNLRHEGWTSFADAATKKLFISSERDIAFPSKESQIISTSDFGNTYDVRWSAGGDAITGGIAGARWCRSVIYVQGEDSTLKNPGVIGMLRSTNGGSSWVRVAGPSNFNDKRFAVTGKGAVVYAFDKSGNVWKTTDGGDGLLTASPLVFTFLTPLTPSFHLAAKLCDSADYTLQLKYTDCDSLIVSSVRFIDDTIGEFIQPRTARPFGKSSTALDTLIIRFKPQVVHPPLAERVRITFRQPDGTTQDTIIGLQVEGLAAPDLPVIAEAGVSGLIDFGTRSVCGGDTVEAATITNTGCSPLVITSLSTDGSPFFLLSSFNPFTLDPGVSRKVLLQFKPKIIGPATGKLTLSTATKNLVISLTGIGKAGERGYQLSQPVITSTICDSAEADILFTNISCTPIRLDSLGVDAPFRLDPILLPANIRSDSSIVLHVHFVPHTAGAVTNFITIHSINDNNVTLPFDTTLAITAVGTPGLPGISLSASSLDFGAINTCSFRDLEITITNTGCDVLTISDEAIQPALAEYTITQSVKGSNILRGSVGKIILHFKPSSSGSFNSTLHLKTNAGDRDIPLTASGSNDPGTISLSATPIGFVLTCRDSGFTLSISNTTCDSLTLDSIVFTGTGSTDYLIKSFSFIPVDIGSNVSINGTFIPQSGGARNATAHMYLHLPNKSVKEITIPLDGAGIQPVVIHLALPNTNFSGAKLKKITMPVQLLDPSVVDVSSLTFSLALNTNLLEPQSFNLDGVISGPQPVLVRTNTSATVTVTLSSPQKLTPGLLGTFDFFAYVTDTLNTGITLTGFTAFGPGNSTDCLPTDIVIAPQSETNFSLSTDCGDSSISKFMKYGIAGLHIESIVPNPASGKISVTINVPSDYENDGILEIFDALGNKIQSEALILSPHQLKAVRTIDLTGTSGLRVLQIRTPKGITSENFYLLK